MKLPVLLPALAVLVFAAGCSSDEAGAMVACERFVEQRVGAQVQHLTPLDGATAAESGAGFVVRSGFRGADGGLTRYTCTVERGDGSWRLVDLATDR